MRRQTFPRSTWLLLSMLLLAGCGDADDDDDGVGPGGTWPEPCRISGGCSGPEAAAVTASVSGDVDDSVSGGALFLEEEDGSWIIRMGTDSEGESGIFFAGEGGRPATGTHAFDATTEELVAVYVHGASAISYVAEEGELTLTQSTSSRVAGGFEFTASDEQGHVVTVEGTFNAPKGEDVITIGGT